MKFRQVGKDGYIWYKLKRGNLYGARDNDGNDIIPIKYTDVEYMCNERDGTHWFKVQQDKGGTLPLDSRGGQIPESQQPSYPSICPFYVANQ